MNEPERTMSRREFLKISAMALAGGLAGAGALDYARRVEPEWIETTQRTLHLPRLDPAFNGLRLVQISDIHMDGWMDGNRFSAIVSEVNALQPDLIAITGDLVTLSHHDHYAELARSLGELRAAYGVSVVLGNHDYYSGVHKVRQVLKTAGVRELSNQVWTIHKGGSSLHIAGLDCAFFGHDRLGQVLEELPEGGAAILLAHEPDTADRTAASGRFDLQLSGHSHGGQVVLPIFGAPILPRLARIYPFGYYQIKGMHLLVNRGLGMVHIPVRFNARPEISVYEFTA
ncbi:MAG TPA: metallophosphoesterase [Anaerolineales bacterium]|nr:metallophosphoesterase [Anaerolineales bacterium]